MHNSLRKPEMESSFLQELLARTAGGACGCLHELPVSAAAYLAMSLWSSGRGPVVVVTEGPQTQDIFFQDFLTLRGEHGPEAVVFPAREVLPGHSALPDPDMIGQRLRTMERLMKTPFPALLVTSIQALLQPTLAPEKFSEMVQTLRTGDQADPDELADKLEALGYDFQAEVQSKGQASRRGGILDLWIPGDPWPVRMEFFGNVVDSIRTFDPVAQRSIEKCGTVTISPAGEKSDRIAAKNYASITRYLPDSAFWIWLDPEKTGLHYQLYLETTAAAGTSKSTPALPADLAAYRRSLSTQFPHGELEIGTLRAPENGFWLESGFQPAPSVQPLQETPLNTGHLEKDRAALLKNLAERISSGWEVHLFLGTEGTRERFTETWGKPAGPQRPEIHQGFLSSGFLQPHRKLAVISESDLYGRSVDSRGFLNLARRDRRASQLAGQRVNEWTDIQPGDLVVHVDHGIGKYLGLSEIDIEGRRQEVFSIEYDEGARLYVPVTQAHLLSRYIGVGKARPKPHALGGKKWLRDMASAETAVRDLAARLLETQAERAARPGIAFGSDTEWQHEFEAAFPHMETEDQIRAIREIKQDMESDRAMDRLVCGDVGYGKTEVAMRAAFKAVMEHRQVGVLVPTTILAQQHFETFSTRMQAFPVVIECLSRFQTRHEQREILERLREGGIDILIGTHRLIQSDVRFKDLGLVIIDEEQRFGVEQKEFLKRQRTHADILTLTATPIPRTLYMSLTGARDMSTIQTPPQERLPIETIVAEDTDDILREAIVRELNRDGQVFFLHNRVSTIQHVRQRIIRLVPEARVVTAHGQMPERELEDVMHRFIHRQADVLVCTTIIESGVDIPNVNTILIDRADRFGLSGLYQLRGRVGRFRNKAYAYLLIPHQGRIFDTARKRISAIKRYSSLGAGFKLALQDLEIRGAGNLLGSEQSGHITSVGFDLYCQLLRRSVAIRKGEPVPPIVDVDLRLDFIDLSAGHATDPDCAAIPATYVEDENQRVTAFRKLAACSFENEVDELEQEFADRFGPPPPSFHRLLQLSRIRILAAHRNISRIETRDDKLMMTMKDGEYIRTDKKFPRLRRSEADELLKEIIAVIRRLPENASHARSRS